MSDQQFPQILTTMRRIVKVYEDFNDYKVFEKGMFRIREKAATGMLEEAGKEEIELVRRFPKYRKLRSILYHFAMECYHDGFHNGSFGRLSVEDLDKSDP